MKTITLLTDFGETYLAGMKGEILKINPEANIIDVSPRISPRNIKEGAFILRSMVKHFPYDSVHLAVIDPGSTGRRSIIVGAKSFFYSTFLLGPDNGLLIPAAKLLGDFLVYEISMEVMVDSPFHGRDVLAPVAANLSKGSKPEEFGSVINDWIRLDIDNFVVEEDRVKGEVMLVDSHGNVVTNIPYGEVKGKLRYYQDVTLLAKVEVGGKEKVFPRMQPFKFCRRYGDVKEGNPLLVVGSHDTLEISVNRGNASKLLNLKIGDEVLFRL